MTGGIYMFMSTKRAAEKWGISDRRIRVLCSEGKIPGAFQEGRGWKIPQDAVNLLTEDISQKKACLI